MKKAVGIALVAAPFVGMLAITIYVKGIVVFWPLGVLVLVGGCIWGGLTLALEPDDR